MVMLHKILAQKFVVMARRQTKVIASVACRLHTRNTAVTLGFVNKSCKLLNLETMSAII